MSTAWWSSQASGQQDKVSSRNASFYALLALLFVAIMSPQEYLTVLGPLRLAFITAIVAVGTYIISRISTRQPMVIWSSEVVIAALLFAWAIITIPLSIWPGGSLSSLLQLYAKTLVMFWLISHVVNTTDRLKRTAILISLMSIPLALTAIYNLMTGAFIGDGRIAGYSGALTTNPNDLALMLNLMIPLTVALMISAKHWLISGLFAFVAVISSVAVLATYSRGGFITLATISVFYVFKMLREGRFVSLLILAFFLFFCFLILPGDYIDRVATIAAPDKDPTGSAQERWSDMRVALMLIVDNPIVGVGIGTNEIALNAARGEHWLQVHNVYLVYGVEMGLPGLFLFLMLVGLAFLSANKAQNIANARPGQREFTNIAEGIKIGILAFSVAAMFSPVPYQLYFYLYAGLAVAAKTIIKSDV
jgi:putative inorganic carbon (hco3(-)) transporter